MPKTSILTQNLPHHTLSPLARAGVLVRNFQQPTAADDHDSAAPHRDAHYLLVLLTQGELHLRLDFEPVVLRGPVLALIGPGQVHQLLRTDSPQGWALSFEPSLLEAAFQLLLEQGLRQPCPLDAYSPFYARATALLTLLADCQEGLADAYSGRTQQALLLALLSLVAGQLAPDPVATPLREGRGPQLERAFQQLLRQHYAQWKQPAQYAAALHITVAHLNDTVKSQTGLSVSAHVQQRAMLEAKRLLGFTQQSVKEIGYALGYEEPVYFGKLFRKVTGMTPQQFRLQFRG
ncbi:AraC family transcriptional regulator [Hymenobacter cellulosilyticus]|uniref:AraC family transcriptional regulator n=1 Tax=Hymenobacter cellulosilyticus TaxID=2932248 RepID=A0A8T9Q4I2_9BACT|nr:AraC family transcriptional regulator [Hymenobacter cellulosilyticus]UOQ70389.1 AraC family transcriptional regulator [Hymenobacter cellulosilyticus]